MNEATHGQPPLDGWLWLISMISKIGPSIVSADNIVLPQSPIFHMRNFNNWVKSILIRSHLRDLPPNATVLDLCCGKGGDLLKWKEGGIEYLVAAGTNTSPINDSVPYNMSSLTDISETAVEQCKDRYRCNKMLDRSTREPPYHAEFIVADCCEV